MGGQDSRAQPPYEGIPASEQPLKEPNAEDHKQSCDQHKDNPCSQAKPYSCLGKEQVEHRGKAKRPQWRQKQANSSKQHQLEMMLLLSLNRCILLP